jgi:hypothetical protein
MNDSDSQSAWLCHVCNYSSNVGEGQACSECYKIACRQHLTISSVLNAESGLYELRSICVACQLEKEL